MSDERAAQLEAPEIAGYRDQWAAAPAAWPRPWGLRRSGSGRCMRSPPRRCRGSGSSTTPWAPPPRHRSRTGCPPRWRRSSPAMVGRRCSRCAPARRARRSCRPAGGSPTTRGSSSCAGPSPRRSGRPSRSSATSKRGTARRSASWRRACSGSRRASPTGSRRFRAGPAGTASASRTRARWWPPPCSMRPPTPAGSASPRRIRSTAAAGSTRRCSRRASSGRASSGWTGSWWRRASRRRTGRIRRIATSSPPASGRSTARPFWRGPEPAG